MEKITFETVLYDAAKLPYVKIDRELFLRKELRGRYSKDVVEKAIEYSPAYAGISVDDINVIAKSCINAETIKVTAISAIAGIPGGYAMIGTIPADLVQYFGHILRVLQELIYLYGWKELDFNPDTLNEETKNILTLFFGVMFGVNSATKTITKLAEKVAEAVAKKLPAKALTKGVIYPIVKKVATILGAKMTKDIFAKGVSKVIPFAGGVISGTITYATYKPMANKLKKYLASLKTADVAYYEESRLKNVIDVDLVEENDEI